MRKTENSKWGFTLAVGELGRGFKPEERVLLGKGKEGVRRRIQKKYQQILKNQGGKAVPRRNWVLAAMLEKKVEVSRRKKRRGKERLS